MGSRFFSLAFIFLLWLAPRPAAADGLPKYECSSIVANQPDGQTWRTVTFAKPFAAPPVVLTGPASKNGGDPVSVRVRNVTATSFDYLLGEWGTTDGVHGDETFSYLAVETGTFEIGGVTWIAGQIDAVTAAAQPLVFPTAFAKAPVVLVQAETVHNSAPLAARVSTVTAAQCNVRLMAKRPDNPTLVPEAVGYLACSVGTASLDGAQFHVGRSASAVGAAWVNVPYGVLLPNPQILAQPQTVVNAGPVILRDLYAGPNSMELSLQPAFPGTAIQNEQVGYLAMAEATGEIRAHLEYGTYILAQPDRATWQTVTFARSYRSPIVVFGPLSDNDPDPARVRVRNVSPTGFEFQVEEWAAQDGGHASETVSYLVAEEGRYTIGGLQWVFGKSLQTTTIPKICATAAFPVPPIVLPQIVTTTHPAPAEARAYAISKSGFSLYLGQEKGATPPHGGETVHYLAVTPGSGRTVSTQMLFHASVPASSLTAVFSPASFEAPLLAAPVLFGAVRSHLNIGSMSVRYRNLTESGADLRVQSESFPQPVPELYSYLALASAVDLDEDGMADDWELAHGLNPADPSDAGADPDSDGRNNLQEYLDGTDPHVADSIPVVTVTASVTDAYRKEGTPAKFQIARTAGTGSVTVQFSVTSAATPAEYRLTDPAGSPLAESVTIGSGQSAAEVWVAPVADGLNHYPEALNLTLAASTSYQVGGSGAASAVISDAAPTPENEQLFVAFLARQGSANTYASGVGTLYLNGPKNSARVSLSFSGLTSAQTNAYLRYGNPGGVGTELRPTLGTGQVSNVIWTIVPAGTHTGQNIIDALYQKGGEYTYVNLGTVNFPVGEIAGTWTRQTGSTVFTPPADPPQIATLAGSDLARDTTRFLTQATFGPTQADIDALVASVNNTYHGDRVAAFGAWIDAQLALPQSNQLDLVQAADAEEFSERGTDPINYTNGNEPRDNNRRRSWWTIAVKAPDRLRQRVGFALSELLVISDQLSDVKNRHYGTAHYYDQLAAAASGNYQTLLLAVSQSPMMGKYLSSLQNQKAVVDSQTGQILISPDENYAREIMQLFSIGLVNRFLDGSLQLSAEGTPIQTYGNDDITNLARVFTGWSFSKRNGAKSDGYPVMDNTVFLAGGGPAYFQAAWTNPMKNFATYHDVDKKTVLGQSIAAGLDGPADLAAAVSILFQHQNTPPFIARQLTERLVTSNPSAGYIYRVAKVFQDNGAGVRGDMKAVIKAVLLDYEARSLELLSNVSYGKQKEPIVRYLQLLRAAGAHSSIPLSLYRSFGYPAAQYNQFPADTTLFRYPSTDTALGQSPLSAPTVFNWFLPDFDPGGAIGAAGLVAPEMQLSTETGVVQAINYHYTLAEVDAGQSVQALVKPTDGAQDNIVLDRTPFEATYNTAISSGQTVPQATATLLDSLDNLLMSGNLKADYAAAPTPNPRSTILDTVSSLSGATTTVRVKEMLYLILTSPEYIHQK